MSKGLAYALFSGVFPALLVVMPQWFPQLSAIELVVGRFLGFGALCLIILIFRGDTLRKVRQEEVITFFLISLFGNLLFYWCVVMATCALGGVLSCVVLALFPLCASGRLCTSGRNSHKSVLSMTLLISSALLLMLSKEGGSRLAHGVISIVCAGCFWYWSSRLQMKLTLERADLDPSDHLLMTGVTSLVLSCLVMLVGLFSEGVLYFSVAAGDELDGFLLMALVGGVVCTGGARIQWRKAVSQSKNGKLLWSQVSHSVKATLFGLFFILVMEQRFPDVQECFVLVLILTALMLLSKRSTSSIDLA